MPGPFQRWSGCCRAFSSLRVPGRFWLMATLCLAVVAGLRGRRRCCDDAAGARAVVLVAALSVGVCRTAGSCTSPSARAGRGPRPGVLRGQVVLYLPVGNIDGRVPAPTTPWSHGWRSVNGYSGFEPNHYDGVRQGAQFELDGTVPATFATRGDLHVVVAADAPRLRALVERQPGAMRIGDRNAAAIQYRLPRLRRRVTHAAWRCRCGRERHGVVSRGRSAADRRPVRRDLDV